jgi:hypothetical protein
MAISLGGGRTPDKRDVFRSGLNGIHARWLRGAGRLVRSTRFFR